MPRPELINWSARNGDASRSRRRTCGGIPSLTLARNGHAIALSVRKSRAPAPQYMCAAPIATNIAKLRGVEWLSPAQKQVRSLRGSGVEPSALRPQLRRIAIKFCRDIFAGGGVMSGEIPRPLGSIALVATLLVSGVGVTVPASANDCLAAPNSPAPQGSHWYYRLDWATQRKCWYVRALGPSAQQAVAPATLARITSVQPKSAQAITATTDKLVQRSANEGNTAPSIMEAPAPQASTSLQTGAQAVGPAPAAPVALPDAPPAVAPVNARHPLRSRPTPQRT
jgi:hypothetical protein